MPVIEFPLIGPSYTNREKGLSSQVSKNLFPQMDNEARSQVSLHSTAGLKTFSTLGGIDRGMHDFNNTMYCVNGVALYSVDSDGINFNLGAIAGDARCVMANDGVQLIIATGGNLYRYTVSDGLEVITDPDITKPNSVAYLNSQFILDNNAGTFGAFATSSIDLDFSIDSLDYATAEGHPDDIVRVLSFRQLVYFFGTHTTEPWQNTGVGNPPFARLRGGVQPYGLAGTHAIVSTPESMYFLDNRRIPRRSSGLEFSNIGNPALGQELAKYARIDDCIAFQFTQDHQQFFAMTFPSEDRTWCYHEPTESWFQLSYGIEGARHRASSMLNIYGANYCADHTNGKIYEYSLGVYSDAGEPIINQRDTASMNGYLLGSPGAKIYIDEVEFIILSSAIEQAIGLGPLPIGVITGICGTSDDLTQGALLGIHIQRPSPNTVTGNFIEASGTAELGLSFSDTKGISFTAFLLRNAAPDSPKVVHLIDLYDLTNGRTMFGFHMDSDGYMNITGKNTSGTTILDVQITNDGASFADTLRHEFAVSFELDDTTKREIYHNGTNITEGTWVTWNTYTDDQLGLEDIAGGTDLHYCFGFSRGTSTAWASDSAGYNGTGTDIVDSYSYLTFNDSCKLVSSAVWDDDGYVRDPQAWSGWYTEQPKVFYANSFHKNSGTTAPTSYEGNDFEMDWGFGLETAVTSDPFITANNINSGLGGTTAVATGSPDAPAGDAQVEIVANFWENTGNWIDVSKLSQTSFNAFFGVEVEGADFDAVYSVGNAVLVDTEDTGNRLQIQSSFDASIGVMYLTDYSGNVVDTALYPGGDSILIPTDGPYYIVTATDTGNAQIKKWDTIATDTSGSVSWDSFFGQAFPTGGTITSNTHSIIPSAGISIAFTVPLDAPSVKLEMEIIESTYITTQVQVSINQTVGDYSGASSFLGTTGIYTGGINLVGQSVDLLPGETYFFSAKNIDPTATNNYLHIEARYIEQ
jgi:hypothetical protein